jgi:heme/copper-type cytochrome/quinol oxidase subunit 2
MAEDRHPSLGLMKIGVTGYGIVGRPFASGRVFCHVLLLRILAFGATLSTLSGCQGRLSVLHPAGPAAETIAEIWWVMLGGGAAIVILVLGLLVTALVRRPASEGDQGGGVWLWYLGLGFPLVTLGALTLYGLLIGERLLPRDTPDLVTVEAEARQWAWTFGYADAPGLMTEDVLHIPAGRPVDVRITSRDVVHSFWVPRLAGKLDALPGHVNTLRIEAAAPGTYAGQSAEFSGTGYREHTFTVEAHGPAAWEAFLRGAP